MKEEPKGSAYRLDSVITVSLSGNHDFLYKYDCRYNHLQLQTEEIHYEWDIASDLWKPNSRYQFTFYQNNRNYPGSVKHSGWNELSNQWMELFQYDYQYDSLFNMVEMVYSGQDENSDSLKPQYKGDYTYSSSPSRLTESMTYFWDTLTANWLLNSKVGYFYDGTSDRILLELNQWWNHYGSSWHPIRKTEYTYNPDFTLKSRLESWYSEQTCQYEPNELRDYYYDSQGRRILYIYATYDPDLSRFSESEKEKRVIGSDGLVERVEYALFSPYSGQWFNTGAYDYVRDAGTAPVDLLLPYYAESNKDSWLSFYGGRMILQTFSWDWDQVTSSWVKSAQSDYYYSLQTVSVQEPGRQEFSMYPNPATDHIRIESHSPLQQTVVLYDLQGRRVLEQPFYGSVRLDVSRLSPGMYICRILGNGNEPVYQSKVCVRRY